MLSVPYHLQERPEWCGPASLQMILGFFGITISQTELAQRLGTNTQSGTDEQALEKVAGEFNFSVLAGSLKFDDISRLVRKGAPVIVAYIEPASNEGHFSVVVDVRDGKIFLFDPEKGPDPVCMEKDFFISRWRSKYTAKKQWMLALLPRTQVA